MASIAWQAADEPVGSVTEKIRIIPPGRGGSLPREVWQDLLRHHERRRKEERNRKPPPDGKHQVDEYARARDVVASIGHFPAL
ncbi:MAG: hypothetical protein M0T84_11555 [Betaproteobacteria bacterium]|nr:hypothetical protein [Betaproteobacteria bacterium]